MQMQENDNSHRWKKIILHIIWLRFRGGLSVRDAIVQTYSTPFPTPKTVFMPPPFEEWWRGIKCYPCPCVHPSVRARVRACVRPSVIKIWWLLNNFWKTASIQFKFGMLIYNIKTQVKFDLGYNPLIFDRVMGHL